MYHINLKTAFIGVLALSLPNLGNTAQVCKTTAIIANTPTSQFVDNKNGTIFDQKTGLIWKKCVEGQTWDKASNGCKGKAEIYGWQKALNHTTATNLAAGFASQIDWRIPNIKELASITEVQCLNPAINQTIFPNTPATWHWSSSPAIEIGVNYAWRVNFSNGQDGWGVRREPIGVVRLVRSGL
jgi:Protein of unknown function (DUF1566)